jgi:hypothetical protein
MSVSPNSGVEISIPHAIGPPSFGGYSSVGRCENRNPAGPLRLVALLQNPSLQCHSFDVVNFSPGNYFEHSVRSERRQPISRICLCMRHKQVRRVKRAE